MVNLQIAAINLTLAENLFIPYEAKGEFQLLDANEDPHFDPQVMSKLCIVLDEAETKDIINYLQ
jgi:hypothetical protein